MFKKGYVVKVTESFWQDEIEFDIGDEGIVVGEWGDSVLIEWDFDNEEFHDGFGHMGNDGEPLYGDDCFCYYIDNDNLSCLKVISKPVNKRNNMEGWY